MPEERIVIDFKAVDVPWRTVNDDVMGGVSRSRMRVTDDGTGVFEGELSLDNNGGFASVRALLGPTDLSGYAGIAVRARGDGRTYQLRFRLNDWFDGIAYRATFRPGTDWTEIVIPFSDFIPTFRGRVLDDQPPLDPSAIQQLVFMIADKTPGAFRLEVDRVHAVGTESLPSRESR